MITITNFSPQSCAYRFFNRPNAERHFKVRDELLATMANEKNIDKKAYYFGQAALRDTKAREIWDKVCREAEGLGSLPDEEVVIAYKEVIHPQLGKTPKMSWWKMWLSNF